MSANISTLPEAAVDPEVGPNKVAVNDRQMFVPNDSSKGTSGNPGPTMF
jgi:hypothetical protein